MGKRHTLGGLSNNSPRGRRLGAAIVKAVTKTMFALLTIVGVAFILSSLIRKALY